jgi:hypothetical protein
VRRAIRLVERHDRRLSIVFAIPAAARVAGWLNAWLDGREGADAVIAGITGTHTVVDLRGLDPTGPLSPALALGELRRLGLHRASVSLPRPGDPLGLGGPADFNLDALEVGEAVVLHGPGLGLLPISMSHSLHWRAVEATPPTYVPEVADADRELRARFVEAADRLAALDVAAWNPEVADSLLNLRTPMAFDTPMPFASGQAANACVCGLRGMEIVALAVRDDGGSLSASEAERRRECLAPLERASRAAVVAACSAVEKG